MNLSENHQQMLEKVKALNLANLSLCLQVIGTSVNSEEVDILIEAQHKIYDELRVLLLKCDIKPELIEDYDRLLFDLKLKTLLYRSQITDRTS